MPDESRAPPLSSTHWHRYVLAFHADLRKALVIPLQEQHSPMALVVVILVQAAAQEPELVEPRSFRP